MIKDRYITKGIQHEISIELQIIMWQLIEELEKKNEEIDYLQVFELTIDEDRNMQQIVHKQEIPEYENKIILRVTEPVAAKIFVIDDIDHVTMLLSNEY